jgi:hypothetical protein
VYEATLQSHPVLEGLGSYGIGTLDLQFHEAEILGRAMATLREQQDIASLPLHDALIVPVTHLAVAGEALQQAFRSYINELGYQSTVLPLVKLRDR